MNKLKIGSKSGLRYFGYEDLNSWEPFFDPYRYIPTTWRGTAVDILRLDHIPFQDRLLIVLRKELCSEKLMRLAAVWFYRDTLNWINNPDPRSIEAAKVAERFAHGNATLEDLLVPLWDAWRARQEAPARVSSALAWSADAAAWTVTWSDAADWSTSEAAARYADWTERSMARPEKLAAARASWAASSAANAVESATRSAELAAYSSEGVRAKTHKRYVNKLVEMFLDEGKHYLATRR